MDKLNKISKSLLYLFVVSGTIWLGSYVTRLSLFYNLFRSDELVLKEYVNNQNISGIFTTLIAAVSINMIFYLIMILSFVFFFVTAKLNLKLNGWLFISVILILVCLPFELYLMSIDYKFVMMVWKGSFNSQEALQLVLKRFTIISSFSVVEILSYLAVIYLFLFQPLTGIRRKLVE